jgi:hypothetical protein
MELDGKTIKLQIVNVSSHLSYVLDHITWMIVTSEQVVGGNQSNLALKRSMTTKLLR